MSEPLRDNVETIESALGLKSASQLAWRWLLSAFRDALKLSAFTLNPWQCAETLLQAADEKPLLASAAMTCLQGISFCVALHIIGEAGGWVPSPIIRRLPNLPSILLYAVVFYPAYWFVRSAIVNLAAELVGAPPRGLSFMCSSACAFSPFILYLPMALILRFTSPELTPGAAYFWVLFVLLTVGYTCLLLYLSVRQTYKLSSAKAVIVLLIPGVVAMALGFISYLAVSAWMID